MNIGDKIPVPNGIYPDVAYLSRPIESAVLVAGVVVAIKPTPAEAIAYRDKHHRHGGVHFRFERDSRAEIVSLGTADALRGMVAAYEALLASNGANEDTTGWIASRLEEPYRLACIALNYRPQSELLIQARRHRGDWLSGDRPCKTA